ncbi:glycoside hydrolase domain-containing protein [Streptomyces sp. AC495_CC817]|uniref:glycoside hydrolase domain-containing protein n=1 Tax=Streptomyces sp. AC495_CC817 TaxID=2823900 RepID=UPI001C27B33B|nr:glycoside hydrolase domain-containing protein [Streptomyces sp. AC495_CC817]
MPLPHSVPAPRRRRTSLGRATAAALTCALLVGAPAVAQAAAPDTATAATAAAPADLNLTQFVDPRIGTSISSTSGYAGNINPGAKVPFGMVTFGPDMSRTNYNGSGGYLVSPSAASARVNFLSLTHLNGVGCPGQGVVGMLPRTAPTAVADSRGVPQSSPSFLTSTEKAAPGAYGMTLDSGVAVELGATERTGIARFTYPDAASAYFSLDTRLNGTSNSRSDAGQVTAANTALTVSDDGRVLSGKTVAPAFCIPWGTKYNSNMYFYAELDKPLKAQAEGSTVNTVVNNSAVLQYDLPSGDPTLNIRVGISSVSVENAKLNLQTENPTAGLEQTRKAADDAWNERLNTVRIDQAADPAALDSTQRANLTKFYTALYRVYGSPTIYSDVNGDFRSMRANAPLATAVDRTGGVEVRPTANVSDYDYTRPDGSSAGYETHYSGLSLWDTYRSQAQLLALLAPDVASDVAQSIVVDGLQCGALPHWVDASDDSTPMSGDNALPVLAGSYAFGARDFDLETAARFVRQSAFDPASACNGNRSFPDSATYLANGYYPGASSANIERYNSDYAAASFLSDVRDVLPDAATDENIADLQARAGLWTNILDPATGTIAARQASTQPGTPGPLTSGSFHESTEPNYFWSFGQSWDGLIEAIGGDEPAIARLNTLFSMDDALTATPTLRQLNGGESASTFYMGNEMGYPAPWAYNWAGKPAASQYVVSQLRNTAFGTGRDGMPGNDDMGAQSSWYVFASLGLFPVSPSDGGLAVSSPLFPAATVRLGGHDVRITTDVDPVSAPFIADMSIDGQPYGRSWLSAATLQKADTIEFGLSASATDWASAVHPTDAAATTTSATLSASTYELGSAEQVSAEVTVASADLTTPAGTVEVRSGDDVIGSAPLTSGSATVPLTIPAGTPAGALELVAVFVPDDPAWAVTSTSAAVTLDIREATTPPELRPDVVLSDNRVARGAEVTVSVSGFEPKSDVTIELHSTPVTLAAVRTDAAGAGEVTVRIPTDATLGAHSVVATSGDLTARAALTVVAAPAEQGGGLATTGGAVLTGAILAGVAALAIGALLLLRARRRRSIPTES